MKAPEATARNVSMNLTPMIDVVFLLIVFFVVSNSMMQNDVSMSVDLPTAESGSDGGEGSDGEAGRMIVNIDAEGNLFFGTRPVTLEELRGALLKEKTNANRKPAVRIRTDRTLPYQLIEPVMVLCAETGISDVSFSVLPK